MYCTPVCIDIIKVFQHCRKQWLDRILELKVCVFLKVAVCKQFHLISDMKELETLVRNIEADGLIWGASKLVPLAYGIKKLQISFVIEDDKISTDFLEEEITKFDGFLQSMDVAAFNKI